MGRSRAQHKGITNTYGSSAGDGSAGGWLTRPGRRRLITLPASGIAISQEDVGGGEVFKWDGVGLELSGILPPLTLDGGAGGVRGAGAVGGRSI